jgi:hypothetical protein
MNQSLKGAVLSGLIFPGLGQIVFKHFLRGAAIMLTVLVSMAVIVVKAVQQALAILEKIEREGGVIDIETLSTAVNQASTNFGDISLAFFLLLIIACWIIGTVDAYRIGRKKDMAARSIKASLTAS